MTTKLASHDIKTYLLAGNALTTVVNTLTGNRFTFKVQRPNNDVESKVRFVKLLTGPDNTSNYTYIGMFTIDSMSLRLTKASCVTNAAQSFQVMTWLLAHIDNLPANVEVWHEGKCGRCGRLLTVPESIANGIGPECMNRMSNS